jgi:hypothetical protein
MAKYTNIARNENVYTPEQWAQIKTGMPRRKWGVPVLHMADRGHDYGYRYPHWWQRAVNWWAEL